MKVVASAVDSVASTDKHCLVPGLGNFGDRFFGTDIVLEDEMDEDLSDGSGHE